VTPATWTALSVLEWTTKRFTDAKIEGARLEAQFLVAHGLKCTRMALYTNFDKPLADDELAAVRGLIKRRLAGEPLAYILGNQDFWSLSLTVTPDVLIPRSDTETLVERVLQLVPRDREIKILELCTGSGAVAAALAKELPLAAIVATEISPKARDVAAENLRALGFADRVTVALADLWPAVEDQSFDAIVANPPYIPSADIARLSTEVRGEPRLALDGGTDGLDFYRRIVAGAYKFAVAGAHVVVEHGFDQGGSVQQLFAGAGLQSISTINDLGKHPRVTSGAIKG
jgi:release factor glutamine methyltransferase